MTRTIPEIRLEKLYEIERLAKRVHPDEPVVAAREVLALVHHLRATIADTAPHAARITRIGALAREWIGHPDLQIAGAGRILERVLHDPIPPQA